MWASQQHYKGQYIGFKGDEVIFNHGDTFEIIQLSNFTFENYRQDVL